MPTGDYFLLDAAKAFAAQANSNNLLSMRASFRPSPFGAKRVSAGRYGLQLSFYTEGGLDSIKTSL